MARGKKAAVEDVVAKVEVEMPDFKAGQFARVTGWRGDNPLYFLASLGVLALLEAHFPQAKLRWREGLWEPEFEGFSSLDELSRAIFCAAQSAPVDEALRLFQREEPPEIRVSVDEARAALREAQGRGGVEAELLSSWFCETETRNKGVDVQATWFHFLAGKLQFLKIARNLRQSLSLELFLESLEKGLAQDITNSDFFWDALEGAEHAYRAVKPAAAPGRVDLVANFCALHGLRLLPVVPSLGEKRQKVAGFNVRSGEGKSFFWPLWQGALGRGAAQSLLAQLAPLSGIGLSKSDKRMKGQLLLSTCGLYGVLRAGTWNPANKYTRFCPGDWVLTEE